MPNALTFDIEEHFHAQALAGVVGREKWDQIESRVQGNTLRLLDVLEEHDVKATFFVLGWVAKRHPLLVRRISSAGHEVACHGYSHQLITQQSRKQFRDETRLARSLLQECTGDSVVGYRAATFSVMQSTLWALDTLLECGFQYDSSIFPIRHDRYGIPNAKRLPHRLKTPEGAEIVEFPPSTTRLLGANIPVAGGGYFRLLPYAFSRWGLRRCEHHGESTCFYLHPWEIDPRQPRYTLSGLGELRHYKGLSQTEARLKQLLCDFAFERMDVVLTRMGLIEDGLGLLGSTDDAAADVGKLSEFQRAVG